MAASPERPAAGQKAAPVDKASAKAPAVDGDAEQKAASAPESPFFARAQQRARQLLSSPDDLGRLVDRANRQNRWATAGPLAELAGDLKALLRLIGAYARGDYRGVPVSSMVLIVGAILYVLTPIDVIPDFIPGIGFLDDAAIITFVVRRVRDEIGGFLEWEQRTGRGHRD